MRAVFLVNPRAGRGRGSAVARELPALLERRGMGGAVRVTEAPGHAVQLAREAAAHTPLVVAVGGDGTAHEVVNGVAGSDAAFGLVPVGTGNDLAMALGIPAEIDAALDILAAGAQRRIDLARFDGDHWFANSLGLGFEAQVTIESRKVTRLRGFTVYLWAVVRALSVLRCPDLRIRADGLTVEGRRLLLCVGNGPRVGGGFHLTPDARNDDGLLDVCVVAETRRARVLRRLPLALRGGHTRESWVKMFRTTSLEIESADGFPFHADGEVIDTARRSLTIHLVPGALRVVAPGRKKVE